MKLRTAGTNQNQLDSNETSWVPDVTSSELVDPDDTTISSSNLGPRDSDQQVTRSGDFDYLPLDASELELSRLTDPSVLVAPNGGNYGRRPRNTNASIWLL